MNATYPYRSSASAVPPRGADESIPKKAEPQRIRRTKLFYERYGILENPFGVTPDPRYLYQSRTHAEARSSLINGVECRVGFQALIAPPGMGKTTILFNLLERFNDVARTAFLFQTHGDSRDFLRYLVSELGGEAHNSDLVGLQDTINHLLIRGHRAGRQNILIIDEAQSLDTTVLETLRLLSNFETPTDKLLQIILAGQPQLGERLATPELAQLWQRISIRTTLIPFDLQDTSNYINHRLKIAGYQGQPLFTPAAVTAIFERSGGVPREINTLCFNALLLATAVEQKQVDSGILHEVVAALALNPIRFNKYTRIRDVKTVDVPRLGDAAADQPAISIDKTCKDTGRGAKTDADDASTPPTARFVDLVPLGPIVAEIGPANRGDGAEQDAARDSQAESDDVVVLAALPDRRDLASNRKTGVVTRTGTRVVGRPSSEAEATRKSTEGPTPTPELPDAPGANDEVTKAHQNWSFLTNWHWIGAISALLIVISFILGLIILGLGKRNFELPSTSHTDAPRTPKMAKILEWVQGVTDKHYPTQSCEQPRAGCAQDARRRLRVPQQDPRTVNSTAHQTTTESSAREIVEDEDPTPGTAIDKSSGQLPNVESASAMSSARASGADSRIVNSTPQSRSESSARDTVEDENPARGTTVNKSFGKAPNIDKVSNTENNVEPVSESHHLAIFREPGMMSSVPAPGVNNRAGLATNIVLGRLIHEVKPIYPPAALKAQIQGSVVLQIIVGRNGAVHDVRFISGPPILAAAAIDAVQNWQYRPSYLNGWPLESEMLVTVKFSLR